MTVSQDHIYADTVGNRPAFGFPDRYFWATDEHILYRDTGGAWEKVAVADYPDLDSIPASFTPAAHKDDHDPEDGGDPLDAAAPGAIDENANAEGSSHSFARADHNHQHTAALHENGGGAELDLVGMSGLLADDQHVLDAEVLNVAAALLHASRHIPGGADPMRWTLNKLLLGAGAGADPTLIDVPVGATLTLIDTEVFSGNCPTSWTDLNLSGIIGAQVTMVLLRVTCATRFTAFRRNGDTHEYLNASTYPGGTALIGGRTGVNFTALVTTDSGGIIEWNADGASATVLDVIAYIK